jgi:RNA polymerase sigma-B factor
MTLCHTGLNPAGEAVPCPLPGRSVPILQLSPFTLTPAHDAARERDRRLLLRYARFGDPAARSQLVDRFLPLARRVAMRYARSDEPLDDLLQVACVGLLKAIDRFDPECGTEFSSYAVPTIAGELRRYFRSCGWTIHLPRPDQERVLAVRTVTRDLTRRLGRSPTPSEVAEAAGMSVEDVLTAQEMENAARPASLDAVVSDDDTPQSRECFIGAVDRCLELVEDRSALSQGLRSLEPRDQQLLYLRFFRDLTQAEIAERLGVSQMHVSRLIRRALDRSRVYAGET